MHISGVHDYECKESHDEKTQAYLSGVQRESLKNEIAELVDEEFERLQDYANDYISDVAAARAERFLERVLSGDEDAAQQLLGDRHNGGRYRQGGCEDGKPWACLIHGRLFETNTIKLRREIVEAHAELLKTERILDLESIVEGLSQQVRTLERRIDEWSRS